MRSRPHGRARRPIDRMAAGILAAALTMTACGDDPSLADWGARWQEVNVDLPARSALEDGSTGEICSSTVGMLRRASADLLSAPNDDLESAFLDWSLYAESVFFECPPPEGFSAAYEEMARLASEIEALLEFEQGLNGG